MQWRNKRVIVTGGAGVIGNELVERLAGMGANVGCFDIVPRPQRLLPEVEYYQRDLSELDSSEFTAFNPEVMFHLAATFERTAESPEFWEGSFKNNVFLSHQVIDAAKSCRHLERFIFASSYLVYSPNLYLFPLPQSNPIKLKEDSLINPRNLCGAAKYYSEKELEYLSNFPEHDFTPILARIFRVYGCGSRDVISRWVRAALSGQDIKVYNKQNRFDFIFAKDVAEGLLRFAQSPDAGGPVNLGSGVTWSIQDILNLLIECVPMAQLRIQDLDIREPLEASCADLARLKLLTGWVPSTDLEKGVKLVMEFEKNRAGHEVAHG